MKSRRARPGIAGAVIGILFLAGTALAGVNVNINIGTPPPAVTLAAPPALAVVPGTYVYVAADANTNMVFYQDNWYRPNGNSWFVSVNYNGPWKAVSTLPPALVSLPQNYHVVQPGSERMPYGRVRDNWRAWERDRHWDHQAKREDRSDDRGRDEQGKHHTKHKKKHHDDDDHDDNHGRDRHKHDD